MGLSWVQYSIPNKTPELAPQWISAYTGKNMVRGYARHFSVAPNMQAKRFPLCS
jgi:hypothetical protein